MKCDTCRTEWNETELIDSDSITFYRCGCGQLYRGETWRVESLAVQVWEFVKPINARFIECYLTNMEAIDGNETQDRIVKVKGAPARRTEETQSLFSKARIRKAKKE